MKKILSVFIVIVAAYSCFWLYEGNKGKSYIEQKMSDAKIHSDSVRLSGFPCYYVVTVENPTWVEENVGVYSKGKFQITTNILGNKFWLNRDGEINVKATDSLDFDSFSLNGQSQLFFELKNTYSIYNPIRSLPLEFNAGNPSVFFEKLKAVTVNGKNLKVEIIDKVDKVNLDLSEINLAWYKDANDKTQTHCLTFNVQDLEVGQSGADASTQSIEYVISKAFSPKKSQMAFEGTLTIPNGDFNFFELPEMSWDITKFETNSNLGSGHAKSTFVSKKNDENHHEIKFDMVSESSISPAAYKEGIKELLAAVKNMSVQDSPEDQKIKDLLLNHEDEFVKVIPKLDELSPIAMNINFHANMSGKTNKTEDSEVKISHLDLTMAPYSIFSEGEFKAEMYQVVGAYKINVEHYKKMVQDSVSYWNNLSKVLSKIYDEPGEHSEFHITPKMQEDLFKFLREVSDEPTSENENLHITFKLQNGLPTIGTLDLGQAEEKFTKIFEVAEEKKPEPKPEPKTEAKPEAQHELKHEGQPQPQPEPKIEPFKES